MSFLSIEQRKAAAIQLANHIRMIDADIEKLELKTRDLAEYRRCQTACREQVLLSCEGAFDADALESIDSVCRERMVCGITHYPVFITSGQKVIVRGVWP